MCGRYTLYTKKKLAKSIALELPDGYMPNYNISPGQNALSIKCNNKGTIVATMMDWGLHTPQNFHINARIESANINPRFRESWQEHRCLLPANGFYEWYQDGIRKIPYYIYEHERIVQFYAGIYFPNTENNGMSSFVILTTQAQGLVRDIHNRMPVIVSKDNHLHWLSGGIDKSDLKKISGELELSKHTVSSRVNRVQNNDIQLITASSYLSDDQMMLF